MSFMIIDSRVEILPMILAYLYATAFDDGIQYTSVTNKGRNPSDIVSMILS